jgi:Spy/CpxP family protein refolding chaperone
MKKALLIALAVFTTALVSAQGRPQMNPQEMAKRQTEAIKEKVNLSQDQYKQVLEINLKSTEELAKSMREGQRDMEAFNKINHKKDSLIKTVLTPDQIKLYEEYLKERREARRNQGMNRN